MGVPLEEVYPIAQRAAIRICPTSGAFQPTDICQIVMIKYWNNPPDTANLGGIIKWVNKTTLFTFIDEHRKSRKWKYTGEELIDVQNVQPFSTERDRMHKVLCETLLARLSRNERAVVESYCQADWTETQPQMAAKLGLTANQYRYTLHCAIEKLTRWSQRRE
jgi:RNA polymerase sigma factor (sigma-70 family)